MKRKIKNRSKKKSIFRGDGSLYVLLILGFVVVGSIMFIGGIAPNIRPDDENLEAVTIVTESPADPQSNMQLRTFGYERCLGTAAINFLIDRSGSMDFGNKMTNLRTGLTAFADIFPENGAIAMQSYSEGVREEVPFLLYANAEKQFRSRINALNPDGATHSRDAFIFAKSKLDDGKPRFPNHNFVLVYISDGIPETQDGNDSVPGGLNGPYCGRAPDGHTRCFDVNQDPSEVAAQIKNEGTRIFTISYTDTADAKFDNLLQNMMRGIASSEGDYYKAPASNQISGIMNEITTKICQQSGQN